MARILIVKGNTEKLIDDINWDKYQAEGYVKLEPKKAVPEKAQPTKKELLARAEELGLELPAKATNAEIASAIAAKEAELDKKDDDQ